MRPPVYLSLTSIYNNQSILLNTLRTVLKQTVMPDRIFLYLSEEAWLLDEGFPGRVITNPALKTLLDENPIISVEWVENTGPFRKLLPLLKEKWEEDCLIITIDDDLHMIETFVESMVIDYNLYGCSISNEGHTPSFSSIYDFEYWTRSRPVPSSLTNFGVGCGGILYKPEFFRRTKDVLFDKSIYLSTCDKQDDVWFYLMRLLNDVPLRLSGRMYGYNDKNSHGLFLHFNIKPRANCDSLVNTVAALEKRGFSFEGLSGGPPRTNIMFLRGV